MQYILRTVDIRTEKNNDGLYPMDLYNASKMENMLKKIEYQNL